MKVGISGHQQREGIDWSWTTSQVDSYVRDLPSDALGYSCLAVGADQMFAERVIGRGLIHVAVIPMRDYETTFNTRVDRARYNRLLGESVVHKMPFGLAGPPAFLQAGRWLVDQVDQLLAVWDGEPAQGSGGTADIVDYAVERGVDVVVIDPIRQIVFAL